MSGRHKAHHSRPKRSPRSPRTRARPRWHGKFVLFAAFGVTLGMVAMHAATDNSQASPAALSLANCAAAPVLSADDSAVTTFGVDASSSGALSAATAQFGHMPVVRVFDAGLPGAGAWTTGVGAINKSTVVVSFNALPDAIISGADDTALTHFFDTAPSGYPIYYSYEHEPEHYIAAGQFTASAYRAAWEHIASIADAAHNPALHATLILTSYDLSPQSGRNWKDYLPGGNVISVLGWDDYPAGTIGDHNPQAVPPSVFMAPEIAAAKSAGLAVGFPEFALATAAGRPAWLAQVASYLASNGALFGIYFNAPGAGQMIDSNSIAAWRTVIAQSATGLPVPAPSPSNPVPAPSSSAPAASTSPPAASTSPPGTSTSPPGTSTSPPGTSTSPPAAIPTPSPTTATPTPSAAPTGLVPVITNAAVRPAVFVPTGTDHVSIRFKVSQESDTAICVVNSQGVVMRELDKSGQAAGWSSSWYFGHDKQGHLLPAGSYSIIIVASNAQGTASAQTTLTVTS
jgi:hypothetical protein